ncbi:MAG: hypothetical protein ACYDDF_00325 [Thermoplasmatota archaeon]
MRARRAGSFAIPDGASVGFAIAVASGLFTGCIGPLVPYSNPGGPTAPQAWSLGRWLPVAQGEPGCATLATHCFAFPLFVQAAGLNLSNFRFQVYETPFVSYDSIGPVASLGPNARVTAFTETHQLLGTWTWAEANWTSGDASIPPGSTVTLILDTDVPYATVLNDSFWAIGVRQPNARTTDPVMTQGEPLAPGPPLELTMVEPVSSGEHGCANRVGETCFAFQFGSNLQYAPWINLSTLRFELRQGGRPGDQGSIVALGPGADLRAAVGVRAAFGQPWNWTKATSVGRWNWTGAGWNGSAELFPAGANMTLVLDAGLDALLTFDNLWIFWTHDGPFADQPLGVPLSSNAPLGVWPARPNSTVESGQPGCAPVDGESCFAFEMVTQAGVLWPSALRFSVRGPPSDASNEMSGPLISLGPAAALTVLNGSRQPIAEWSWSEAKWTRGDQAVITAGENITFLLDAGLQNGNLRNDTFWTTVTDPDFSPSTQTVGAPLG